MGLSGRLIGRHGVDVNGPIDEELPRSDHHEEDEVGHDHHAERVAVTREVRSGDRQRDADPGLTVELPVVRQAQQREASQQNAHRPDWEARRLSRASLKAEVAEREAKHEEAVNGDESYDEGWHFIGHQSQEPGHLAACTVFPRVVFPQVRALVQPVNHADHSQVHTHQKVGHTQVSHKHVKTQSLLPLLQEHAVDEAAGVAHQRQSGEDRQEDTIRDRPQQSIARRQFVRWSVTVLRVEAWRQSGWAAQLVVVGVDSLQVVQPLEDVTGKVGHGAVTQVQHTQLPQGPEASLLQHVHSSFWQVESVQLGHRGQEADVQNLQVNAGQIQHA